MQGLKKKTNNNNNNQCVVVKFPLGYAEECCPLSN